MILCTPTNEAEVTAPEQQAIQSDSEKLEGTKEATSKEKRKED